jgi:hypothetical protein
MHARYLLFPFLALALSACAQQKYDWGDYSASLRDYYADPNAEPAYEKTLALLTSESDGRKVAPGLCAEYGYEELSHGDVEKAVALFEREKAAWPESTFFMDKAIAAAKSNKKPTSSDGGSQTNNQPGT